MECFKKWFISNAVDGTDNDTLWKGSEEGGNGRGECEELTVNMGTVALIGKGG